MHYTACIPMTKHLIRILTRKNKKSLFLLIFYLVQALPLMLAQPGASRWILEASVPYGEKSMNEILFSSPAYKEGELTGSSSVSTALVMAEAAFQRAANLSDFGTRVVGVAATCALKTDRIRRGTDRAIVAVVTGLHKFAVTLTMSKNYDRTRKDQDELASLLVIEAVYSMVSQSSLKRRALNLPAEDAKPWILVDQSMLPLEQGDDLEHSDVNFLAESGEEAIQCLLDGKVNCIEFAKGHVLGNAPRSKRVYLPGSFNPLHDGHRDLLSIAESKTGMEGAFELSVMNADKGTLEAAEIWKRVQQFIRAELPIVLTKAPLFTNKADLFSDSVFVVGYDTAIRLINPKYYGGSAEEMQEQFSRLSRNRCRFLVAGRLEGPNGVFLGLKDLKIPQEIKILERIFDHSMFDGISEDEFRNDISSTELRARGFSLREHTQRT